MPLTYQLGEFDESDIHLRVDSREDHLPVALDPLGAQVAALGPRCWQSLRPPGPNPTDRCRYCHAEPRGGGIARHAAIDGGDHPVSKVLRKCPSHPCWPPIQPAW